MEQTARLAWWISLLAHPFVMVALLVAVAAMRQSSRGALHPVILVLVSIVVPVAGLMVRQVRRGRWSNADASNRSERPVLFAVTLSGLIVAVAWLLLSDPQSFLVRGLLVTTGFILFAALLTRWIKLSLHVAFAAMTATALALIGSPVGYGVIAAVPVLAWARLSLARHTLPEVVVGLALGVATGIVLVRV